ncbi:MAG TPA: hypothetical protein PLF70_00775 [Candidatus Portnoybacteria bacterium]|jgi:myo-inositol catabolism protein IolC|nr:hypothetical protein [Candidatus Portnoybacteria bacterium]MDD5752025.1 hypothetical protein [Candidatus Portnoybacteria bacterium]HNU96734.1 hypothetical protein [Candidatus Portnoybacteria bacterium]HOZ16375.1 hypothetical protein [Candidatus Portnoybacteria bacterium]HPH52075.1 hypothetical protein [Candidatus Portnoybacteria bacterium]
MEKFEKIKREQEDIAERILRAAERNESEEAVELLEKAFSLSDEEWEKKKKEAAEILGLKPEQFKNTPKSKKSN